MDDLSRLTHFTDLGGSIGFCVKNQTKKVLYQNQSCINICGNMTEQVCAKGCMALYNKNEECSAVSEGMKHLKAIDLDASKTDVMIINDGQSIITMLYPLNENDEKFKKQAAYFQEKGLTKSEIKIMQMALQGMKNSTIAEKLFISKATLKTHLNNIYKKLPASMHPGKIRG